MTRDKQTVRDWSEFIEWGKLTEEQKGKVRDIHADLQEEQFSNFVWRFSPEDELIGFTRRTGAKDETININARYYLVRNDAPKGIYDVQDRAAELRHLPCTCILRSGTEQECRNWITRNCDEPSEHAPEPFRAQEHTPSTENINPRIDIIAADGTIITDLTLSFTDEEHNREQRANAALFTASPKLLALLEQYHAVMPTKESGALIAEARGWT